MSAELKNAADTGKDGSDRLTVLRAMNGIRMTKLWKADGSIDGYEDARNFAIREVKITGLEGFHRFLLKTQADPSTCVIRGRFVGEARAQEVLPPERPGHYLRRNVLFEDHPLHLFLIDIDGYRPPEGVDPVLAPVQAIDAYVTAHLPAEFHGVSYVWQLSSSAGSAKAHGTLKAHVWFWLETPRTSAELKAWAKSIGTVIDSSVFQKIQAHYTALPVFEDGVPDPVPVRLGYEEGWYAGEVALEIGAEVLGRVREDNSDSVYDLPDPREKKGVIGAFCRAFEIEEVLERWLSDVFVFEDGSERRLTYLNGGGAAGGAFITADRQYVVNKHNTDPLDNRATNKFDLVRVHVYGGLDEGADALELMDVTSRPSYEAAMDMMRLLPEVREQLNEVRDSAVAGWVGKIAGCASGNDVQDLAEHGIAYDKTLSDMDRAVLVGALQQRAKELTGVRPTKDVVVKWVKRKGRESLPDINADGYPLETAKNLAVIIRNLGVTVRYNVIAKKDEVLIPGASWTEDNAAEASLAFLIDACHREEMRTGYIKNFLTMLADQNVYNPVLEWVESKPWDGVSRLQAFYDTVEHRSDEIRKGFKETLIMRWMISAIRAVAHPEGVAAQGVLTFQGAQYAGKTRWLKSLAPVMYRFIHEGLTLDPKNKDSVKIAITHWIVELGELDATFRKADLSALKSFTTQPFDILRRPYAATESQFARRTVFGASVNDRSFLQDPTGNRRFWTIPVARLNHDHGLDMQQVWAEVHETLYKKGVQHFLTEAEMRELEEHNMQFTAQSPIAELIASSFDWNNFDESKVTWMTASGVLRFLGMKNPSRFECIEAGTQISKLIPEWVKRKSRKSHGHLLRPVPEVCPEAVTDFDGDGNA